MRTIPACIATLALLIIFLASCMPFGEDLSPAEAKAVMAAVGTTLHSYQTDVSREGLMAERRYLDSSADFYWVPPGYAAPISYDSVMSVLRINAPSLKSVNNAWESLRVTPLSRILASYSGILCSATTDTSGKTTRLRLIETGLLIKRKDGWKLMSGQTTVIPDKK